jgi:predicted kinase
VKSHSDRATLHFICGKAASGKTTLARELAARHAAVLFGEDEWLTLLEAEINSLADYGRHSRRLRAALAPLVVRLLRLGVSVVLDFAGNTPKDRVWVRSIFEDAGADHVLHCIIASDELCKAQLRLRNATKQEGLYFGFVSEERFDEVTRYFTRPADQEDFRVISYEAAASPSAE